MIGVLTDSSRDAALISEAAGAPTWILTDEDRLGNDDAHVDCWILGFRYPIPSGRLKILRELERVAPWVPTILVTDPDPEIARRLRNIRVAEIVWFDDLSDQLQTRIHAACRSVPLLRLADLIERSTLPPGLGSGLAFSLRAALDEPVRNVKDLAAAVSYSPSALSRKFRESVTVPATLNRFLSALVIVRAHQLRSSGLSWEAVGQRLGLARQTLHRKSTQWPGSTLKQLERIPRSSLLAHQPAMTTLSGRAVRKVACLAVAAVAVLADGAAAQDVSVPSGMGMSGLWIGMAWTVRDAAEPDREARRSPSVSRIRPCSPAHFAGLQPGDALLSVNGRDTRHGAPFPPGSVGTEYTIRVERKGTGVLTLRLQLARRPTKVLEPVSEAPIGSPADWKCPPLDLG